jgi:multimeric flavodoxin WrbA
MNIRQFIETTRLATLPYFRGLLKFSESKDSKKKVVIIGTTSNSRDSSSWVVLDFIHQLLKNDCDVKVIDANELHIVKNLSCYSSKGKDCAHPDSGPYRCWAHHHSLEEPEKYGGKDEMPIIYDALEWADIVIWGTSTRWGSHSAILQNIIERMNTLENRNTVYGEKNPLSGKRAATIATGQHWKTDSVVEHLQSVWNLYGFNAEPEWVFSWQKTQDMNKEQVGPNDKEVEKFLKSKEAVIAVKSLLSKMLK